MLLVSHVQAQATLELNVVDTNLTCNLDSDCPFADLDYITGPGKPTNDGMVCCATFPRETWSEAEQSYVK